MFSTISYLLGKATSVAVDTMEFVVDDITDIPTNFVKGYEEKEEKEEKEQENGANNNRHSNVL